MGRLCRTLNKVIGGNRSRRGGVAIAPSPAPTPSDIVPDQFSFPDQIDVPLSVWIYAPRETVIGTDADAPISVTGTGVEYQIEDGPWTAAPGIIPPNGSYGYRVMSSDGHNTETPNSMSIGGVSASMLVRTAALDITPDATGLVWTPVADADPTTHYQQTFAITDTNGPAPVTTTA